jgi:hypothetical protein
MNAPSSPWRRGRRVLRRIGRTLAALVGLIVVLGLVGAMYESAAEAADVRAYPPPRQLVDVGGYRLHIDCIGAGSPTVMIGGLGYAFADHWETISDLASNLAGALIGLLALVAGSALATVRADDTTWRLAQLGQALGSRYSCGLSNLHAGGWK